MFEADGKSIGVERDVADKVVKDKDGDAASMDQFDWGELIAGFIYSLHMSYMEIISQPLSVLNAISKSYTCLMDDIQKAQKERQ